MEIEKNVYQQIASVAWLTFIERRSALQKKVKNFESKYHDIKVKSLKQQFYLFIYLIFL